MPTYRDIDNVFEWRSLNGRQDDTTNFSDLIREATTNPNSLKEGAEENRLNYNEIVLSPVEIVIFRLIYGGLEKRIVIPAHTRYRVRAVDYNSYNLFAMGDGVRDFCLWLPKYLVDEETGQPINWRSLVVKE